MMTNSVLLKMLLPVLQIKRKILKYTIHRIPYLNQKILAVSKAKMDLIKWCRRVVLLTLRKDVTTNRYL